MKEKMMIKNSSVGCNIDLKIYNKQHGKNMRFVQSGVGFTPSVFETLRHVVILSCGGTLTEIKSVMTRVSC